MQRIFLAFTNPIDGREAAFNEWYDAHHVPEVLRYGRGFTGCQRFKMQQELQVGPVPPWQYLALYDLSCDDLATLAERPFVADAPALTPFRGLLQDDHVGWVYTLCDAMPSAPAHRPPHPWPSLLFAWSLVPLKDPSAGAARRTLAGRLPARRYELSAPQRRAQLASPWVGLTIYELADDHASRPPLDGFQGAWQMAPVSTYVARAPL